VPGSIGVLLRIRRRLAVEGSRVDHDQRAERERQSQERCREADRLPESGLAQAPGDDDADDAGCCCRQRQEPLDPEVFVTITRGDRPDGGRLCVGY
jgi:hypothetical protein